MPARFLGRGSENFKFGERVRYPVAGVGSKIESLKVTPPGRRATLLICTARPQPPKRLCSNHILG